MLLYFMFIMNEMLRECDEKCWKGYSSLFWIYSGYIKENSGYNYKMICEQNLNNYLNLIIIQIKKKEKKI